MSAKEADPVRRYSIRQSPVTFEVTMMDVDNQYNPIPLDLTGSTGQIFRFQRPDGTVERCFGGAKDPDDLTNGTIECVMDDAVRTQQGLGTFFDQVGIWTFWPEVKWRDSGRIEIGGKHIFYVVESI